MASVKRQAEEGIGELARQMEGFVPGIWQKNEDGTYSRTQKGSVRYSGDALREALKAARKEATENGVVIPPPPTTEKTGKISTSKEFWQPYRHEHRFLNAWFDLQELEKKMAFLDRLETPVTRSRYHLLTRTGRTSCSSPNVQQIPRDEEIRDCILAREGSVLYNVDYSNIELRTLAQECLDRYGHSQLAETVRDGRDPHAHTAAQMLEMDYTQFTMLKKRDPETYETERQRAKAINFGFPGGLGVETFCKYARNTFGLEVSQEEARQFRKRFTTEVYPELGEFLREDGASLLAQNLGTSPIDVFNSLAEEFGCGADWLVSLAVRVIRGHKRKASNGERYAPETIEKIRIALTKIANPEQRNMLGGNLGSGDLSAVLLRRNAVTRTGRMRANVTYTAQRNTPFQGLAADGAKMALFRLVKEGHRVCAFVHDSVKVEVPGDREQQKEDVDQILVEEMGRAVPDVPIEVEEE